MSKIQIGTRRAVDEWIADHPDQAIPRHVQRNRALDTYPCKYDYSRPVLDRLMDHVEYDVNGGCWLWSGPAGSGRPRFVRHRGERDQLAYRVCYELIVGAIPAGAVLCHKCDQPFCINPAHVFIGTQAENMRDMWRKGRGDKGGLMVHRKGVEHHATKLSEDDVRAIRADPRDHARVAADYGVSKSSISNIRRGNTWSHVR